MSAATVKQEERDVSAPVASSSTTSQRLPPYLRSVTGKPAELPKAYLNGTQDMLSLFGLMPIYDRAVRPYNPDTIKAESAATASNAAASTSANTLPAAGTTALAGPSSAGAGVAGATPSSSRQGHAVGSNSTPRQLANPPTGGAQTTGMMSHGSTGRISTPALQLNGGPPTFSLHTDSSAILAASPGQMAVQAAAAPPAKKPTKPPATYAHYIDDLAGRVRPPSKRMRAAKADKGASLMSILMKPEYTPQRIVPLDKETMQAAFSVEPGVVPEIDQALLEPDEEETRPKKKKKKNKQETGIQGSSGPSSAARTPVRR